MAEPSMLLALILSILLAHVAGYGMGRMCGRRLGWREGWRACRLSGQGVYELLATQQLRAARALGRLESGVADVDGEGPSAAA